MKQKYQASLIVLASLLSPGAHAYDDLTLTLSGEAKAQLFAVETSADRDIDAIDARYEGQLKFKVSGETSLFNYGGVVILETSDGNKRNAKEAYLYIQDDSLGRLSMGNLPGPSSYYSLMAPELGYERNLNGDIRLGIIAAAQAGARINSFPRNQLTHNLINYEASKFVYETPLYKGFQAALSYAPDQSSRGEAIDLTDPSKAIDNVWQAGLRYSQAFDEDWAMKLSGTWITGDSVGPVQIEDTKGFTVGAEVSYRDWAASGGWMERRNSREQVGNNADFEEWAAGIKYNPEGFGFVAAFHTVYIDNNNRGEEYKHSILLGGEYDLAQGVKLTGDLMHTDSDNGFDDISIGMLGTTLSF